MPPPSCGVNAGHVRWHPACFSSCLIGADCRRKCSPRPDNAVDGGNDLASSKVSKRSGLAAVGSPLKIGLLRITAAERLLTRDRRLFRFGSCAGLSMRKRLQHILDMLQIGKRIGIRAECFIRERGNALIQGAAATLLCCAFRAQPSHIIEIICVLQILEIKPRASTSCANHRRHAARISRGEAPQSAAMPTNSSSVKAATSPRCLRVSRQSRQLEITCLMRPAVSPSSFMSVPPEIASNLPRRELGHIDINQCADIADRRENSTSQSAPDLSKRCRA